MPTRFALCIGVLAVVTGYIGLSFTDFWTLKRKFCQSKMFTDGDEDDIMAHDLGQDAERPPSGLSR